MGYYALIANLVGDAGQAGQEQQVLGEQQDVLKQGIADQEGYQGKVNDAINNLLGNLKTDTPAKAEADALTDYRSALDSALPSDYGGNDANYSGGYNTAAAAEKLGQHAKAFDLAGKLSHVTAPQTMRRQEGYQLGDVGQIADMYRNFAKGDQGVTDMKVNAVHENPYMQMLFGAMANMKGAGFYWPEDNSVRSPTTAGQNLQSAAKQLLNGG